MLPDKKGAALDAKEVAEKLRKLDDWEIADNKLVKVFDFAGPEAALEFVFRTGKIANEADHHPVTEWSYRTVTVTLFTHAISGLSVNDFIVAAKFDEARKSMRI